MKGAMSIWGALMGGTNMLLHGVGLARGWPRRVLREIHHRREMLADHGRVLHTDGGRTTPRSPSTPFREAGPWRPFLRREHNDGALRDGVLYAAGSRTGGTSSNGKPAARSTPLIGPTKIWKQLAGGTTKSRSSIRPSPEEMDAYIDRRTREGGAPYI